MGLKVAPVLNLAQCQTFVSVCRLHHFCHYFDSFTIKIGAKDISALSKTTKAPKSGKKMQ